MAIETRIINGYLTEIYVGGNFITQSAPTNFHQFYKRKILTASENISDFKEVTEAQKAQIEAADEAVRAAGYGVRTAQTPQYESIGAVFNDATGYYELNGLTDLTEEDMRVIYAQRGILESAAKERAEAFARCAARTLPPFKITRQGGNNNLDKLFSTSMLEKIVFDTPIKNKTTWPYYYGAYSCAKMFESCLNLRVVKGFAVDGRTALGGVFDNCPKLEEVEIVAINYDISFAKSNLLSVESIEQMVEWRYEKGKFTYQSSETKPFTITLHPDAYARLTDELIAAAAEKQITFATT